MRLLATSDLHLTNADNRDWLIVAGDVSARMDDLTFALEILTRRFAQVIWVPGNHDLWTDLTTSNDARGQGRYEHLVGICRSFGVLTPEDSYVVWPGDGLTTIVPMFLLYDYSFRPAEVPRDEAVTWARSTGVLCTDERRLDPSPWPSRAAWCEARCRLTEARLDALPAGTPTVLVNHWPLRYDLARPPRIPRFSIWCGTTQTEDWARRYHARVVVNGHLHLRTTMWRHGVRYEEVSLGYPRDWKQERGMGWYLREILPGDGLDAMRFVPPRDPFR
jgi:3',5'-cyclic AMP phosphodiesterase CpdA